MTKKLHLCLLPVLIMVTLHTLFCGMHNLLYVHNIIVFTKDLFRYVIFVAAHDGHKVAITTGIFPHFSSLTSFVFSLAIFVDQMLWKLRTLILTCQILYTFLCLNIFVCVMNLIMLLSDSISHHYSIQASPHPLKMICSDHIQHCSCHRLHILLVYIGCHSICTCFGDVLCFFLHFVCYGFALQLSLQYHQVMPFILFAHLLFVASIALAHLWLCCFFNCSKLSDYFSHHFFITYTINCSMSLQSFSL